MNPDHLINPFIVYWDLRPDGYTEETALKICDELIKSKIFVLNLRDLSTPVSSTVNIVLDKLEKGNIKARLTISQGALEKQLINILQERGISLFIDTDSIEQISPSPDNIACNISFSLNKNNFLELPAVISACVRSKVKELELPIQRADHGEIFFPDEAGAQWLSSELKNMSTEEMKISVHDPFLWKLFHAENHPEGAGCNGAYTMIYISPVLDVTPCPLLPISMGNIQSGSLKEVFVSEKRRQIREALSSPPQECLGCGMVNNCIGGCRGRTYVLFNKTFDKKDPACQHHTGTKIKKT